MRSPLFVLLMRVLHLILLLLLLLLLPMMLLFHLSITRIAQSLKKDHDASHKGRLSQRDHIDRKRTRSHVSWI